MHGKVDRRKNDGSPYLRLTLSDSSGHKIDATLWEEISNSPDRVDRQKLDSATFPTIIEVTSMKVTEQIGQLQLGSSAATYLYVNPETPAATHLRNSFNEINSDEDNTGHSRLILEPSGNIRITLAELLLMKKENLTGKTFVCNATITEILNEQAWYSNGCPQCSFPINKSGDQWACANHGKFDHPKHTYCITVTIADNSGRLKTTISNDTVAALLGKSCNDLVIQDGYSDDSKIPEPIEAMKGKNCKFQLQLQTGNKWNPISFIIKQASILEQPLLETTKTPPNSETSSERAAANQGIKRALFISSGESISNTKQTQYKDD